MTVIETEPAVAPRQVEEPSLVEQRLQQMLQMVKQGMWTRNTADDGDGHHCVHGLIIEAIGTGE